MSTRCCTRSILFSHTIDTDMNLIVISRDPRTAGYRWIKDGSRPVSGDAGSTPQEAACTAVAEAIRAGCKVMAPPEVAGHIPKEYLR
jgi:hypothetical protein